MVRRSVWSAQHVKNRTTRFWGLACLAVLAIGFAAGCKSMPKLKYKPHWPWSAKSAAVEPLANQIAWEAVEGSTAVEFPQHWLRNTLVIDMTSASGGGSVRMHAKASMGWPVRMALRVKPGSIASVEIQAEQRVVIPIIVSGAATADLAIAPGVYNAKTPTVTLSWR
jgi:hypothetical protein